MRVLVVYSGNNESSFVDEQIAALKCIGVDIVTYRILKKGISGYLSSLLDFKSKIKAFSPQLIHAHYGLSGLFANLQRKVPVITTYHGCDINKFALRFLSVFSILLSASNIFVSEKQSKKVLFFAKKKFYILPCGINVSDFYPIDKSLARAQFKFDLLKKYILFSSSFSIPVKNVQLAKQSIKLLDIDAELIELKGYTRQQVNLLMNACDVGLLTSLREGSPMFIKELLATNTPIVSTDVGDVSERINGVESCFIAENDPDDLAIKLKIAMYAAKTNGRIKITEFDNDKIAKVLLNIYSNTITNL